MMGFRFIDRDGRYLLQKLMVTYMTDYEKEFHHHSCVTRVELSRTWVAVPLVPETYIG